MKNRQGKAGRPISFHAALPSAATYDTDFNVTAITSRCGHTTTMTYDGRGNLYISPGRHPRGQNRCPASVRHPYGGQRRRSSRRADWTTTPPRTRHVA